MARLGSHGREPQDESLPNRSNDRNEARSTAASSSIPGPIGLDGFDFADAERKPAAARADAAGLPPAPLRTEVFAALGLSAASLSLSGQIVEANEGFRRLIPDVIVRAQQRICFRDKRSDRLFQDALDSPPEPGPKVAARVVPVPAGVSNGPMLAHLLHAPEDNGAASASSLLLLFVRDIAASLQPSPELVQRLFDLTPAETRVAQRIAQGCTVREISASTGVAPGTIRAQLKAIFAKTGSHRQADLARIFARLTL